MAGICRMRLGRKAREAAAGRIEAAPGQEHAADLECSVCTAPAFRCPVKTVPCGHMFHEGCLQDWLKDKAGAARLCPNCRKELPAGEAYTEVDRPLKAVLDKLRVDCPQGCEPAPKRVRYDQLDAHFRECPETPVFCSSAGCDAVLPRKEMQGAHAAECPHALVPCEQCQEEVKRSALQNHMERDCLRRRFACGYCQREGIAQQDREAHELQCTGPVQMSAVAILRRTVAWKLHDQNDELQALRDENKALQQQSKEQLQLLQTMLYRRIKVHSDERADCAGVYGLLPERRNGSYIWGTEDGRFLYKIESGSWIVALSRDDMQARRGALWWEGPDTSDFPVGASGNWLMCNNKKWEPAPGSFTEAMPCLS
eukprot:TRINITY_DN3298_c0_g1_i3.p1 TRINITY_DN3298_c0_g1~~TRINITY_DN3298_c0_g1_i3.p1  ORF type:complete len:398 (+),score=130.22 TRINITY_DN3298_c0_g1_i3:89-1195(+)